MAITHMVNVDALYAKTCRDLFDIHKYGLNVIFSRKYFEHNINWNGIVKPVNASAIARLSKNILVVLNGRFVGCFRRKQIRHTSPLPISANNDVNV